MANENNNNNNNNNKFYSPVVEHKITKQLENNRIKLLLAAK